MFLADSLLTRSSELRDAKEVLAARLKQVHELSGQLEAVQSRLETANYLVRSKTEQLDFVTSLFKEEKEEKKVLYDRIQEFAGLKEREQLEISGNKTIEFKATEVKRGRGAIKAALEERAEGLLKKQRENEAQAVANGELAP